MSRDIVSAHAPRFSLVVGGPFHDLLRRMGLTGADLVPTWRAAVLLAVLAWLVPAVATVAQSLSDPRYSGWGYFSDLTAYTSFLVAIGVMIATERYADGRLAILAEHFDKAQLLAGQAVDRFQRALVNADRSSSSSLAETVLLILALLWSGASAWLVVDMSGSGWEGRVVAGSRPR